MKQCYLTLLRKPSELIKKENLELLLTFPLQEISCSLQLNPILRITIEFVLIFLEYFVKFGHTNVHLKKLEDRILRPKS